MSVNTFDPTVLREAANVARAFGGERIENIFRLVADELERGANKIETRAAVEEARKAEAERAADEAFRVREGRVARMYTILRDNRPFSGLRAIAETLVDAGVVLPSPELCHSFADMEV